MSGRSSLVTSLTFWLILGFLATASFCADTAPPPPAAGNSQENKTSDVHKVSLKDAVDIALKNNQRLPASKSALAAAEAQHQQALSAFWPQIALRGTYTNFDDNPNFIFPARTMAVPSQSISIPANAFMPGFPRAPLNLQTPAGSVPVPEQNVKLMNKSNLISSLNVNYPLFTGGLRLAKMKQAQSGVEAAKEEVRRTDLEVMYDVNRMYYAVVLAQQLLQIGRDALARLEVTLELTENLYKKGSGRVKKTDYLRNKSTVEGVRTLVASLKSNDQLARAALLNTMGLEWNTRIEITETHLPYQPYQANLEELISQAYRFNPDWGKLKAGMEAARARISEARSGYLPKVLLTGSLTHIDNSYNMGVVTPQNKDNLSVGLMFELPLFQGFLTLNKMKEARAHYNKTEAEQILLREGIALQVKDIFHRLNRTQGQHQASKEAMDAATENRELNERAYQNELVETKDVLEAQIMESFMQAQHYKVLYDHLETKAHLNYVVGQEVVKFLGQGQGS
jgi:outer membrane protein